MSVLFLESFRNTQQTHHSCECYYNIRTDQLKPLETGDNIVTIYNCLFIIFNYLLPETFYFSNKNYADEKITPLWKDLKEGTNRVIQLLCLNFTKRLNDSRITNKMRPLLSGDESIVHETFRNPSEFPCPKYTKSMVNW